MTFHFCCCRKQDNWLLCPSKYIQQRKVALLHPTSLTLLPVFLVSTICGKKSPQNKHLLKSKLLFFVLAHTCLSYRYSEGGGDKWGLETHLIFVPNFVTKTDLGPTHFPLSTISSTTKEQDIFFLSKWPRKHSLEIPACSNILRWQREIFSWKLDSIPLNEQCGFSSAYSSCLHARHTWMASCFPAEPNHIPAPA